jgi:hypothetical protein
VNGDARLRVGKQASLGDVVQAPQPCGNPDATFSTREKMSEVTARATTTSNDDATPRAVDETGHPKLPPRGARD